MPNNSSTSSGTFSPALPTRCSWNTSGNEVYTIWEWYHAGQDMRSPFQPFLRWTGDMPNVWKIHWGVDPFDPYFATSDYDNDGLTGWDEYFNYTDPNNGDTDGDSYPDGDEIAGSSDPKDPGSIPVPEGEEEPPASQDSDGDGLDDHWEWEHGLSYQSSNRQTDTDGDGFSDYEEYVFNTDPGSSSSKPTRAMYDTLSAAGDGGTNGAPLPEFFDENVVLEGRWVETSELKRGEFIQNVQWYYPSGEDPYYEPVGPPQSSLVPTQKGWSTSAGESSFWDEQTGGNPEPAPALADLPWEQISSSTDLAAMHGRAYPQEYDGEYYVDSTHSVQLTHHSDLTRVAQIRLARRSGTASTQTVVKGYAVPLTVNGAATDTQTISLELVANQIASSATLLEVSASSLNQDKKDGPVSPLEVRIYDLKWKSSTDGYERDFQVSSGDPTGNQTKLATTLKVAQWDGGVITTTTMGGTFHPDKIKDDRDAFFLRIKAPPPNQGTRWLAKVWTLKADGTTTHDSGANVALEAVPGHTGLYQSDGLCLVSDDEDDHEPTTGGVSDGAQNDQTFKVELGGTVCVGLYPKPRNQNFEFVTKIPVPALKKLVCKMFILKDGVTAPVDATSTAAAQAHFDRAKERFAQAQIELDGTVSTVASNPTGVVFESGTSNKFNEPTMSGGMIVPLPTETKALFDEPSLSLMANQIGVYFVSNFDDQNNNGLTMVAKALPIGEKQYARRILWDSSKSSMYGIPHEFLHVLIDGIHAAGYTDFSHENGNHKYLWYAPPQMGMGEFTGITGRKRISDRIWYQIMQCTHLQSP